MKKKVITGIVAVLILGAVIYVCMTRRINLNFDSEGKLIRNGGMFTVSFEGSDQYTDEELAKFLFENDMDANPFLFLWNDKFGEHVEIPFIEEYDVEVEGLTSYKITFYEKSVVGYIKYMGSYKYFDKDGIVVESSDVLLDGVPYVTGIDVDHIILHSKLPVKNERVFDVILEVTQLISKYGIKVEKINISGDMEIRLYLGNVRVDLGKNEYLSEKMMDLNDIIPNLGDVKGVLDMKEYDAHGNGYTLRKDE